MKKLQMLKLGFGNQCLLALITGVIFGIFANDASINFILPFGLGFLKLLKLIVIPLTFSTIVSSIAKLDSITYVKQLGIKTLMWFLITAIIASSIALIVSNVINLGSSININIDISQYQARVIPNLSNTLLDMLPGNIFTDISQDKMIPVIIFAVIFGITLTSLKKETVVIQTFFHELVQIMFKITKVIIRLSPIAIFSLIANVSHSYGLSTLYSLGKFIAVMYIACILQIIVYLLLMYIFAKQNPITFIKKFYSAMLNAFILSSSAATLPITLDCLINKLKIRKDIAGFVAPLGSTMKMDGCGAIYPTVLCVLTANLMHIDLTTQQYIIIVLTSAIASIGTAGVPGTASIMATVVLTSLGLPLTGLAVVIGIDKIIDTIRTTTNVTGAGACSVLVNYK